MKFQVLRTNDSTLKLIGAILLKVRLGSATYRIKFIVADHLSASVIIGSSIMKKNVRGIMCMDHMILLTRSKIPILAQHQGIVSEQEPQDSPRPPYRKQERVRRDSTKEMNCPHTIRLAKHVLIPPMSQLAVPVTTQASGFVFIEPKHALQARYHVRTANGIVEVKKNEKFSIVLSNFSKATRRLPKHTVIGYATRNPLGIFTIDDETSREFTFCVGIL